MNGVDTIRSMEETTFISCSEYESMHHQHHPTTERFVSLTIAVRSSFVPISFYNRMRVDLLVCLFSSSVLDYPERKKFRSDKSSFKARPTLIANFVLPPSLSLARLHTQTHAGAIEMIRL